MTNSPTPAALVAELIEERDIAAIREELVCYREEIAAKYTSERLAFPSERRRAEQDIGSIDEALAALNRLASALERLSAQAQGGEDIKRLRQYAYHVRSYDLGKETHNPYADRPDQLSIDLFGILASLVSPQRSEPPQPLTRVVDMMAALRGSIVLEQWQEEVSDLVAEAYAAGCQAVHDHYTPDTHPDFSEAASDYAAYKADRIVTIVSGCKSAEPSGGPRDGA